MTQVGIVGGGQLAKMLAEAATALGVRCAVYAQAPDECAALFAPSVTVGATNDVAALTRFLDGVSVVTFESEFFPLAPVRAALTALAAKAPFVAPSLAAMEILADKAEQKKLFEAVGAATAPYLVFATGTPAATVVQETRKRFGSSFVLKWAKNGYDGKGLRFGDKADDATLEAFVEEAFTRGARVYAEETIAFRRECALVGVRGKDGSFAAYPLLVLDNGGGVCQSVQGPASALGVAPEREKEARRWVASLAERVGYVGTIACEMFETNDGRLLGNEIAPRVHNSGHVTQDAALVSQFENHWRALLGLPLGDGAMAPSFAMRNLLGPADAKASLGAPAPTADVRVHWYGKAARAGRKLGHLNAVGFRGESPAVLLQRLEAVRDTWANAGKGVGRG